MEKTLKRVLCLALALLMVLSVVGCTDTQEVENTEQTERVKRSKKSLVGQWKAEVDYAEFYNETIADQIGVELGIESFMVSINLTINENGTYKRTMDGDFDVLLTKLTDALWEYAVELLAKQAGISVEEMEKTLAEEGQTKEALLKEMDAEGLLEFVAEGTEGKWVLDGDELYMAEENPEDTDPIIIEFDGGDEFSFIEITDEDYIYGDYMLPIVYERVSE